MLRRRRLRRRGFLFAEERVSPAIRRRIASGRQKRTRREAKMGRKVFSWFIPRRSGKNITQRAHRTLGRKISKERPKNRRWGSPKARNQKQIPRLPPRNPRPRLGMTKTKGADSEVRPHNSGYRKRIKCLRGTGTSAGHDGTKKCRW